MTGFTGVAEAERTFAEHEHRELAAGIADLETVAGMAGQSAHEHLSAELRRVHQWYQIVLRPHAGWEEYVLYPEIDARAQTEWATRLMRYEHVQIARIAALIEHDINVAMAEPTHERVCAIRGHLYSLAALLRAHLEREDMFLMPVLRA